MANLNPGSFEHRCIRCGVKWSGEHPPDCDRLQGVPCLARTHTPAPWRTVDPGMGSNALWIVGNNPRRDDQVDRIASVFAAGVTSESEANARLIVAAPDLLDACIAALREFREFFPTVCSSTLEKCEAALAKAGVRELP